MAKRHNHYEAAFEEYLRSRRIPYIAVDEARRALMNKGSLKCLDFLVSPSGRPTWLVDVKGRRFPAGRQGHYWKNWSTADDVSSLRQWERNFAVPCAGLLVFAYHVVGQLSPLPEDQLLPFRGNLYAFLGIRLADFTASARMISPKWRTWAMPAAAFRQWAAPVERFFLAEQAPLTA